jgi:hypothetical protein
LIIAGLRGGIVAKCKYIAGMTNNPPLPASTIKFEVHPSKVGAEWEVVASFPTQQREKIAGFKTEAEAVDWIGSYRCLTWVKARGYS